MSDNEFCVLDECINYPSYCEKHYYKAKKEGAKQELEMAISKMREYGSRELTMAYFERRLKELK